MEPFTKDVIELIKNIPEGKIMTYGQIAALAGRPRHARQVVRVLHTMSNKYQLPWHRVINAKGELAIKDDELFTVQKYSLESEGIIVQNNKKVNLAKYRYHPDERT